MFTINHNNVHTITDSTFEVGVATERVSSNVDPDRMMISLPVTEGYHRTTGFDQTLYAHCHTGRFAGFHADRGFRSAADKVTSETKDDRTAPGHHYTIVDTLLAHASLFSLLSPLSLLSLPRLSIASQSRLSVLALPW